MDPATISIITALAGPVLNDLLGGGGQSQAAQQAALLAQIQAEQARQRQSWLVFGGLAAAAVLVAVVATR